MEIGKMCIIAEFNDKLGLVLLPKDFSKNSIIDLISFYSKDGIVNIIQLKKSVFSFEDIDKGDVEK